MSREAGNNYKRVKKFLRRAPTGKKLRKSKRCVSCLGVLSQSSVPDPSPVTVGCLAEYLIHPRRGTLFTEKPRANVLEEGFCNSGLALAGC